MKEKTKGIDGISCTAAVISFVSIVYLLWSQFTHLNPYAASWDQVDFSLALERFDLMAMQPHFPGYPYFILGGKLAYFCVENRAAALTAFNIVFYASSLFPVYRLGRRYTDRPCSLLIASLLYSSSYTLIIVNQPMSEGAALACLWWYFWSLEKALNENSRAAQLLPLFFFSVLMGIRLSYLPFAAGLLYLFYKKKYTKKQWMIQVIAASLFQFVWVGALILSEGSLKGFVKLSLSFTSGHFNSWGNTAVSSSVPFLERVKILVIDNMIWTGMSAQSAFLLAAYALLAALGFYRFKQGGFQKHSAEKLAAMMGAAYFIWALFAQNIDKPRHILPVVMLLSFLLLITIMKKRSHSALSLFLIVLLLGQSANAGRLVKEQAIQAPATYQLAGYLENLDDPAVVYMWEEARVMDYLDVPVSYKEIKTYTVFLHDQSYYKNSKIYLTDKVLEGFKAKKQINGNEVVKIKEFKSNALFNPVYDRIVLYEWKKPDGK